MKRYLNSQFRDMIVGVNTKVPLESGEYVTAINFDNAATTPPFCSVMKAIMEYAPWYASVHRGKGHKSVFSSELYEESRITMKKFVGADHTKEVVFTKNTTESINILAYLLQAESKEQVILSTDMEHLANDLPWRENFTLDYVKIKEDGQLSLADLKEKLVKYQGRVTLVTVTGASNVTGYINPVYRIAELAHKYGAKILVDGAQLVPHAPFDMKSSKLPDHIDYLAFSGHKLYAPFGAGVLIGPQEDFAKGSPVYKGGGAVGLVSHDFVEWDNPPNRYEAGTPNMMGVVAMTAAIQTMNTINCSAIHDYEKKLIDYAIKGLRHIPDINLYCCSDGSEERVSLISFTVNGLYHSIVAAILAQEAGIAARSGLFCAHPYVEKLLKMTDKELAYYHKNVDVLVPGLVRISFGLYNTYDEINVLLELLTRVVKNKNYYNNKYKNEARNVGEEKTHFLWYC